MGTSIPKQFLEVAGRAIILRSIDRFTSIYPDIEVIVVLPEVHFALWEKLNYSQKVKLVKGGEERFHSIQNALKEATGDLIAIHDAVRPFVADEVIQKAFDLAEVSGAVIPVVPIEESMRKITFDESETVPRASFRIVQTPQVFKANVIKMAYEQPYHLYFTDDATVVEECGHDIILIEGNEENIKITSMFDLKVAETLAQS
jgi:2-C-methyl-D-erythritol 4-phosphate cytidylyltransferase